MLEGWEPDEIEVDVTSRTAIDKFIGEKENGDLYITPGNKTETIYADEPGVSDEYNWEYTPYGEPTEYTTTSIPQLDIELSTYEVGSISVSATNYGHCDGELSEATANMKRKLANPVWDSPVDELCNNTTEIYSLVSAIPYATMYDYEATNGVLIYEPNSGMYFPYINSSSTSIKVKTPTGINGESSISVTATRYL
ncbi:MAG: hypothetical protein R6U78_14780 [Bacteroidales bacterium]